MASSTDTRILDVAKAYAAALRDDGVLFESVWLFGSFTAERFTEDSDIDIAVVMADVPVRFLQEVALMRYRRNIDTRIEPHVLGPEDLDSPFGVEITTKGIQIA